MIKILRNKQLRNIWMVSRCLQYRGKSGLTITPLTLPLEEGDSLDQQ